MFLSRQNKKGLEACLMLPVYGHESLYVCVTIVLMMRSMVSVCMMGLPWLKSTAMKSLLKTIPGELAISLIPISSMFLDAATANIRMPSSRALSADTLMPPHGFPVTWPSVITTAKRWALGEEGERNISWVMFMRAQSM